MKASNIVLSCLTALLYFPIVSSYTFLPILPADFKPPQVFKNTNLVRNINLEREYPRETIVVVIENVDSMPQDLYYLPFVSDVTERLGGLEVTDRKDTSKPPFQVEFVEHVENSSSNKYCLIHLPTPLAHSAELTLSISYYIISALEAVPGSITQDDDQYVQYSFSASVPSAYDTKKQKTTVKFLSANVPDYTAPATLSDSAADPTLQDLVLTYGPYADIPAGTFEQVQVRYEFSHPLIHATRMERDIEVSHWGGNLATEERYWLENNGATLSKPFSRSGWQVKKSMKQRSTALVGLYIPLASNFHDFYYTDDIGNVSTSHFNTGNKRPFLELNPRYPIFGGWRYNFRIGWNADLGSYLKRLGAGQTYVLKVPFLEGPRMLEGVEYKRVQVRIILPEGANNVEFDTPIAAASSSMELHRTFMDTIGRTMLVLSAENMIDDLSSSDLIIRYDYPTLAALQKPLTIFSVAFSAFFAAWAIGRLDISIGRKNAGKAC